MPSEKPISAEKVEKYRLRLREMRDRMLGEVEKVVESIRDEMGSAGNLSKVPVHLADAAPEQVDADIDIVETERGMLGEIQAALHRIDDGTFGRCVDCGASIRAERLQAIPYTPYCIACANKHDAEEEQNETDRF